MIGFVVCGHGHFATGMYSALELISGTQKQFIAVDFVSGMGSEEFHVYLADAVALVDKGDGVIIFADLLGGTPFNQAVLFSKERADAEVIGGTNLAMLVEGAFIRGQESSVVADLKQQLIDIGKQAVRGFGPARPVTEEKVLDESGI